MTDDSWPASEAARFTTCPDGSVLTFFAEDAASHTLLYANADLSKATQNNEVLAFADHWRTVTGTDWPAFIGRHSRLCWCDGRL